MNDADAPAPRADATAGRCSEAGSSPDPSATDGPPGGWPRPRVLYVHVPFCRHRCGYCNFSVIADRDDLIERYLLAIDRELSGLQHPEVETVFIGGGTPTHLPADPLRRLLESIQRRVHAQPGVEFSVEANPEDITAAKVALLAEMGVNRVSLGVQSFQPAKLRILERSHLRDAAVAAVETVAAQIPNVSLDLIFAAPGETLDAWRDDVNTALNLPIVHLSTYALTFEKGTPFWNRRRRGELQGPGESLELAMYQLVRQSVAAAGWEQYEVSNFAVDGNRCQHNVAYWQGRGWYAVGPGAASFQLGRREVNHRSTTSYLKRIESGESPVAESEPISREQYARERAAFGVRMIDGIDLDQLREETGIDLADLCNHSILLNGGRGLLTRSDNRLQLTERGILFADTVASDLLG